MEKRRRRPPTKGQSKQMKSSSGRFYGILTLVVLVLVSVLGVTLFFRVQEVSVTGNTKYTSEEVVAASGILEGDNLVTLSNGTVASQIRANLPYVEDVRVEKKLPNRVAISVTETAATYEVTGEDGSLWLVSSEGKVLEPGDITGAKRPAIIGINLVKPAPGEMAQVAEEQQLSLAGALSILEQLETTNYLAKIVQIDVEKSYDMKLLYEDQFEIHLAGLDQMEYKIRYLTAVLDTVEKGKSGIIDLTLEEKNVAILKPW